MDKNKYEQLRKKHPLFIYHSYELNEKSLVFHFQMDEYHFYPKWEFDRVIIPSARLEAAAFSLGMAELVSYWKCACCPRVEIRCGALSEDQIRWWKKLYFNGLGEFFYRNDIDINIDTDFDSFMTITAPYPQSDPEKLPEFNTRLHGALVPVGGGKDSAVTLELLKEAGEEITPYIINPRKAALGCVEVSGIALEQAVCPKRTIDKTLLELNSRGYLNGHTPFSAVVAFSALVHAIMLNKKYIVLSNESSANESYVEGRSVNHQYSKSTEFERDFRDYCASLFGENCPEYFSLLRPLSEWQIARAFVNYPEYFPVFQSCNLGGKTDIWCCNCAKCLYVYILLSAFLNDDELVKIFGTNMLERSDLSEMFDGLILDGEDKPFECVGTKNEVRLSLHNALKLRGNYSDSNTPPLLKRFEARFPDYQPPIYLTGFFDRDNYVPEKFIKYLEKTIT